MSAVLPPGYTSIRDAAALIENALFAGRPEHPNTVTLRQLGFNVREGDASRAAMEELWHSVDRGKLQVVAIAPKCIIQISAAISRQVPLMRRVCDLSYLRPGHDLHRQFVGWFGADFARSVLAVRQEDAERLARAVLRARRRKGVGKRRPGRPSLFATVGPIIQGLIEAGKWNSTMSLKMLTQQVDAELPRHANVSEDTVTRILDRLYQQTGDRRLQRLRRRKRR